MTRPPALQRAAAAAVAALLAGCAAGGGAAPAVAPAGAPPPRPGAEAPAPPAAVGQRIRELEAAGRKGADPAGAGALELALLYTHPANPAPDHAKALAALRGYLATSPNAAEEVETGRLLKLLEAIERLGQSLKEARAREKELAGRAGVLEQAATAGQAREDEARRREQALLDQIKTLQQRIEQLQKLDLEMEQRRRSVR